MSAWKIGDEVRIVSKQFPDLNDKLGQVEDVRGRNIQIKLKDSDRRVTVDRQSVKAPFAPRDDIQVDCPVQFDVERHEFNEGIFKGWSEGKAAVKCPDGQIHYFEDYEIEPLETGSEVEAEDKPVTDWNPIPLEVHERVKNSVYSAITGAGEFDSRLAVAPRTIQGEEETQIIARMEVPSKDSFLGPQFVFYRVKVEFEVIDPNRIER